MTLSYWWMHWFWITSRFILATSNDTMVTSHSISPNPIQMVNASSDLTHRAAKEIAPAQSNPPINDSPSNSPMSVADERNTSVVKFQKPSSKKMDFIYSNMTTKLNATKVYFRNKEPTVIPQNSTDFNLSKTGTQKIVNISFVNSVESQNFSLCGNDTNFNQSLINSERIAERDEDISENLSAAGITGITLGCVIIVGIICGVSFVLYRNRSFNRPQVLSDRCSNPDSSGYIDDASVRDNSEEMYSLDNDSFLNSLEAMTIQNYWTDTVKHTKL